MTDQADQMCATGLVDTKQQVGSTKRRQYSEELKRQIDTVSICSRYRGDAGMQRWVGGAHRGPVSSS